MPEEIVIPKNVSTFFYKSKGGSIKELHVLQSLEPGTRAWTTPDIQRLARELGKVLQEDAL
jgi:hypothetical protein